MLVVLLFLIIIISIFITSALWFGMQLTIENINCKEDLNNLSKNILNLKIFSLIQSILLIIYIIISLC